MYRRPLLPNMKSRKKKNALANITKLPEFTYSVVIVGQVSLHARDTDVPLTCCSCCLCLVYLVIVESTYNFSNSLLDTVPRSTTVLKHCKTTVNNQWCAALSYHITLYDVMYIINGFGEDELLCLLREQEETHDGLSCVESVCEQRLPVDGGQKSHCLRINGHLDKMIVRATQDYCALPLSSKTGETSDLSDGHCLFVNKCDLFIPRSKWCT